MPVNRITILLWTAGFALVVAGLLKSSMIGILALLLGGIALCLLFGEAIKLHLEQRREELHKSENDDAK